jgi:endonuclease YncB( thermonuclease family)
MAFLLFSKPVRAEIIYPDKMTVEQFYVLDIALKNKASENEWDSNYTMLGYLIGIRRFNSDKYYLNGNEEAVDCIGRPLNIWIPLVFDKYKLNKIKGDDLFYLHFIKTIEEVCNVDLFGLAENKITKPIPSYKVSEVTDGDTVKIIKNGEDIKVRLVDIDCYETSANPRGKWQAEYYNKSIDEVIKLGNQSKEILQDFVNQQANGKVVLVDRGKDKYKRTLGILYIDGVNVNDYMLQYGKCEKYVPRKN